jgi:hypothetical protein
LAMGRVSGWCQRSFDVLVQVLSPEWVGAWQISSEADVVETCNK